MYDDGREMAGLRVCIYYPWWFVQLSTVSKNASKQMHDDNDRSLHAHDCPSGLQRGRHLIRSERVRRDLSSHFGNLSAWEWDCRGIDIRHDLQYLRSDFYGRWIHFGVHRPISVIYIPTIIINNSCDQDWDLRWVSAFRWVSIPAYSSSSSLSCWAHTVCAHGCGDKIG